MSRGVLDDDYEEPGSDDLWEFEDELLDDDAPDEDVASPGPGELLLDDGELPEPSLRRRPGRRSARTNGNQHDANDSDSAATPSWRVIEMRREQRDLDEFLREVFDE